MAALVFDSGALIALERGDRQIAVLLEQAAAGGIEATTSCACVAEVWRAPARQARLTRALTGLREHSLDSRRARACGALLAKSATDDVTDAALCGLVREGDTVVTSDPEDIAHLLEAAGTRARVRSV